MLLVLTFVRGLLYLALIPPWQHYDEPTHFEYIRLIAERRQIPEIGDYDLNMRREIAASMKAADFWGKGSDPVIDLWSDQPPRIGVEELGHPPLYYVLAAVPQFLVAHQELETQLYLARLISVLLYVLTVAAAYGLLRDMFPRRRWLPLAVGTFIALLPPLTDLMSAVNSDVGAVTALTLLLWASVRLIRYGPSPRRVATTLLLTLLCFLTKSTAAIAAIAILGTLAATLIAAPHRRWLWLGLFLLALLALPLAFTWGKHATHWYSDAQPAAANRTPAPGPLGPATFVLSTTDTPNPSIIFQELQRSEARNLRGNTVTLGAWLKAKKEPGGNVTLGLHDGSKRYLHRFEATTDWQFYAFTATVGAEASGLAAYVILPEGNKSGQTVYVDGIVLARGARPLAVPPQFDASSTDGGKWGSQEFQNLLINSSADRSWPGLRSWLGNIKVYQKPLAAVFHSVLDMTRTAWVYGQEFSILLQSFWGRFAWNQVALPIAYFYPLGLIMIAGLVVSAIGMIGLLRSSNDSMPWQRRAWAVMGMVWLVAWGSTILRIHPVFLTKYVGWPVARYASVAIVPTATFLCWGLAQLLARRWLRWLAFGGLVGLVTLDAVALLTVILPFYYG
jgi:hypothetical protein